MNAAKIRLSPTEKELVTDARFILTKNNILQKTKELLGMLQVKYQQQLQKNESALPATVIHSSPKISRGENYKGLPWLMLDYPRFFTSGSVFAVRTMFWWGNFFSITLHLAGEHKKRLEETIARSYPKLKKNGFSVCISSNEWEHHFEKDNYLPVATYSKKEFEVIIRGQPFIKLSQKIPVGKWDNVPRRLHNYFKQLTAAVTG